MTRAFTIGKTISQLISCGSLGAEPVTDHTRDWRLLLWKFKHDSELLAKKLKFRRPSKHHLVMNTLRLDDFKWLGNVPTDGIIRMRQEGELQDLRNLLGKNIQDLQNVSDEDFVQIGQEIKYNLNQALKKHAMKVKGLNEKYRRRYNFGIASSVVTGTLAFATALYPPVALATGIASAIGGGTIIGTIEKLMELREEMKELQKKPVAMLFEAKKLAT